MYAAPGAERIASNNADRSVVSVTGQPRPFRAARENLFLSSLAFYSVYHRLELLHNLRAEFRRDFDGVLGVFLSSWANMLVS
jgi:hypothetical protein